MEPDAKYALVGATVMLLAAAIVLSMLWLSGGAGKKELSRYTIYFKRHSLSGLQVDSQVTMRGINVGAVQDFQISANDIEKVRVLIKVNADTPIKHDTSAVISRNLVTGIASIDLTGSTSKSEKLDLAPAGEDYPIIKEGATELGALASSLPGAINDAGEILAVGKTAISPENAEKLTKIIDNLEQFSNFLSTVEAPSKELIDNLAQISSDIANITEGNKSVFSGFKTTLDNVKSASGNFNEQSKNVLSSLESGIDRVTLDIDKVAKEISKAARSVSVAMESFEDPSNLLTGPGDADLGPGEKRP